MDRKQLICVVFHYENKEPEAISLNYCTCDVKRKYFCDFCKKCTCENDDWDEDTYCKYCLWIQDRKRKTWENQIDPHVLYLHTMYAHRPNGCRGDKELCVHCSLGHTRIEKSHFQQYIRSGFPCECVRKYFESFEWTKGWMNAKF
jgi:hypothetical protein